MSLENTIFVIGSSNTDMVVKSAKLPAPGETVIGGDFLMNPGGKGANQAVSAARLGGNVSFVCKIGNDLFGKQALQQFRREGIDTRYVATDSRQPSGVALINVDEKGENCISVAPGANGALMPSDVAGAIDSMGKDVIMLIQLEIPLATVDFAVGQSARKGVKVLLNPAPARTLPDTLYPCLYAITPNETEAELLTGIHVGDETSAHEAAAALRQKGCPHVVITLGGKGAYLLTDSFAGLIPAPPVTAVDTTAAGDCFNGALSVALSEGLSLVEAVKFACKAASISVTRMGAQSSIPSRHQVDQLPLIS